MMSMLAKAIPTRSKDQPPVAYLDSSDYSVLSRAMDDPKHPAAPIYHFLADAVDKKQVQIRFSSINVVEMAHLDTSSIEFALGRARCLQRLSRGKCFRFWTEVTATECKNIIEGRPVYIGVTSDDGEWFPDMSELGVTLRKSLMSDVRRLLRERAPNRQQRRAAERQWFPDGKLSKAAIEALQPGRCELLSALAQEFPFGDRFYHDDMMLKYAAGQVSEAELLYEMTVVFRDVEKFIGWTYETRDKERAATKWLRATGQHTIEAVEKVRREFANIVGQSEVTPAIRRKLREVLQEFAHKFRRSRLENVFSEVKSTSSSFACNPEEWRSQVLESEMGSIPSFDAYIIGGYEHFRRHLEMSRNPKQSDTADILHLCYLPYCELFRADGDFSSTAAPVAEAYGTKVVSKLSDLPRAIDRCLQQR
jgi:hypothetical protein